MMTLRSWSLALFVAFQATACGEAPPVDLPPESEATAFTGRLFGAAELAPSVVKPAPAPGLYFSRFGPHQGLVGTRITVLGLTDPWRPEDYVVTIGGVPAINLEHEFLLEVEVAPGTVTGPLCVRLGAEEQCGSDFTVLTGPVLYSAWPDTITVGSGNTPLQINGDGFDPTTEASIDGQRIPTEFVAARRIETAVPERFLVTAGTLTLTLHSRANGAAEQAVTIDVRNLRPGVEGVERILSEPERTLVRVTGYNFIKSSVIFADNEIVPTRFESETSLIADVSSRTTSSTRFYVNTPPPGGGISGPVFLPAE